MPLWASWQDRFGYGEDVTAQPQRHRAPLGHDISLFAPLGRQALLPWPSSSSRLG